MISLYDTSMTEEEIRQAFYSGTPLDTSIPEVRAVVDTLLRGSSRKAQPEELASVQRDLAQEQEWLKDLPAFVDDDDVTAAIVAGTLHKMTSDANIKLIMRLESPEFKDWIPYLRRSAADLFHEIGIRWRQKMNNHDLSEDIRLAATGMVRTTAYQQELVAKGDLAIQNGPHAKGYSFDIDGCGYYDAEGSINPRQSQRYTEKYIPQVHALLKETLDELKAEGKLSYILEFPGTSSQGFHITRNPHT